MPLSSQQLTTVLGIVRMNPCAGRTDLAVSMARRNWNKVFVTGGTSFIGLRVVAALVDAGADVTVLVLPDNEEKLGPLRRHVRLVSGDVWNPASLKGRARGQGAVIHLVGSIRAQPERGLTFQQLNLVSARNTIGMSVSDGVPYFVLLSANSNPAGVSRDYLRSKREAEEYLRNSGLHWSIVRAPLLYDRTQRGSLLFRIMSGIGSFPFIRVLTGRRAPLPVEVAGRGLAQIALQQEIPRSQYYFAKDLRRWGRIQHGRTPDIHPPKLRRSHRESTHDLHEDAPFGWLPGETRQDKDE